MKSQQETEKRGNFRIVKKKSTANQKLKIAEAEAKAERASAAKAKTKTKIDAGFVTKGGRKGGTKNGNEKQEADKLKKVEVSPRQPPIPKKATSSVQEKIDVPTQKPTPRDTGVPTKRPTPAVGVPLVRQYARPPPLREDTDKAHNVVPDAVLSKPALTKDSDTLKTVAPSNLDKYKDQLKLSRERLMANHPKLAEEVEKKNAKKGGKNDRIEKTKVEQVAKGKKNQQALANFRGVLHSHVGDGNKKSESNQKRVRPFRRGERVFNNIPIVKRAYRQTPLEEVYSDATLSLIESLRHGIYSDENLPLDYRQKEALLHWLNLLSVALPPELQLHFLIDDLRTNIEFVSQKKSHLIKMIQKHPIKERKWSKSCTKMGRSSSEGGFFCGFWRLLHIVGVGFGEQRGGRDLAQVSADVISPHRAGEILREVIVTFFSRCDDCVRTFVAQYDECDFRHCDRLTKASIDLSDNQWRQFALYIWEVHNAISVRVLMEKESGQSPGKISAISVVWPEMERCVLCIQEDGTWDEDQVHRHLIENFWSGLDKDFNSDLLTAYERSLERAPFSDGIFYLSLILMAIITWSIKRRTIETTGHHKKHDDPPVGQRGQQWRRI